MNKVWLYNVLPYFSYRLFPIEDKLNKLQKYDDESMTQTSLVYLECKTLK